VTPIPYFINDTAWIPVTDINYFGIAANNLNYAMLTSDEFQQCLTMPGKCQISAMRTPITPGDHCVIKDWTQSKSHCPLKEVKLRSPFMKVYGNKTVYSVADTYTVLVNCFEEKKSPDPYVKSYVTLHGQGTAILMPKCTLKLNDGRTYHTSPPAPKTITLHESNLLRVLNFVKPQEIINISMESLKDLHEIPFLHLSPMSSSIQEEIINELTVGKTIALVIQILGAITGIILLASCLCFNKHIRLWFRSWCLLQTADRWVTKMDTSAGTFMGKKFQKWSYKTPSAPCKETKVPNRQANDDIQTESKNRVRSRSRSPLKRLSNESDDHYVTITNLRSKSPITTFKDSNSSLLNKIRQLHDDILPLSHPSHSEYNPAFNYSHTFDLDPKMWRQTMPLTQSLATMPQFQQRQNYRRPQQAPASREKQQDNSDDEFWN
jgi:hypothetical protein